MGTRTPEQIEKDILKIEKMDNAITDKIDREETQKETIQGLESFDAELVYKQISSLASVAENTAAKFYQYEIDMINNDNGTQAEYWNTVAKERECSANDLRNLLTNLVRLQKGNNIVKRGWKEINKSKKS